MRPSIVLPAHIPLLRSGSAARRLAALDMLRGVAMLLMALDHSLYFNHTGVIAESYGGVRPHLSSWPYVLSGLLTNIATGIFFALAGISVALFERSRRKRGWSEWAITRFFLIRAGILAALDVLLNVLVWHKPAMTWNVLLSIALGLVILAFARRLPLTWIAVSGVALFLGYPLLVSLFPYQPGQPLSVISAILFQYHTGSFPYVDHPALGRLSLVLLGYVAGRLFQDGKITLSPRILVWVGLVGLGAWLLLRLVGSYGNFLPYRVGWQPIYFLIENKEPPSLTYQLFNLSWAVLLLAALQHFQQRLLRWPIGSVLSVLGQTSLFFFVAHLLLYSQVIAPLFGVSFLAEIALVRGYLEFALGIVILVPVCALYLRLRREHPGSVLQYL